MRFFSPKTPAERRTLTFDFTEAELPTGVTISAAVSITATVWRGADPSPQDILSGAPAASGLDLLHLAVGGLAGVDYLVSALVDLSDGQRAELMGVLPVRATI